MPAIQANTYVPLEFFRFLNKKQRPVQFYIGGRPQGAGYNNTIYVLATEHESEVFINLIRKFKMPSLFYERMSSNSDIDAGFKTHDPEELIPANVLVLIGNGPFNPKEVVEPTEDNKKLLALVAKDAKKTQMQLAELIKLRDAAQQDEKKDPGSAKDKIKKIEQEIAALKDEAGVTQLALLHGFAREKLGNKTKNPGAFLKGKYTIGTHVVQFNADMTICFIWGSYTQHMKVDPKETLKQLPFVKQVITSYL